MNIRVADIQACYELWKSRGAEFITEPKDKYGETRCYIRDPDGYIIEVGQSKPDVHLRLSCRPGAQQPREDDPEAHRDQREAAQRGERGRIAEALGDPAAEDGADRAAEALRRHHRALGGVHPAGAVHDPRDQARRGDADQARATPSSVSTGQTPQAVISWLAASPRSGISAKAISSTSQ